MRIGDEDIRVIFGGREIWINFVYYSFFYLCGLKRGVGRVWPGFWINEIIGPGLVNIGFKVLVLITFKDQ